VDDGHTRIGAIWPLRSAEVADPARHRKPLSPLLWAQERYLRLEVAKLERHPHRTALPLPTASAGLYVDRPFCQFVDLVWNLEAGPAGWLGAAAFYAFQRMLCGASAE